MTTPVAATPARPSADEQPRVWLLAAGVAIVALALAGTAQGLLSTLGVPAAPAPVVHVPWWVLVALFAAAQAWPLHLQLGKQVQAVSLTELPLVLGLMAVPPSQLVAARLIGGLAAELVIRRHYRQPVKLSFNTAVYVSETLVAVAVFRSIGGGHLPGSANSWSGAVSAAISADVFSCLAVVTLISLVERRGSIRRILSAVLAAVAQGIVVANIGVVAGLTVRETVWAVIPLLCAVATFIASYRVYVAMAGRHTRLQHLYAFSRDITGHAEADVIVQTLLRHACDVLLAGQARLSSLSAGLRVTSEVSLEDEQLASVELPWLRDSDGWILSSVAERGVPMLIARDTRGVASQEWLSRAGLREAMLVPIDIGGGEVGVVILADRLGEVQGFDDDDLQMFQTLSQRAAVELRSAQLVNRLRHESLHDQITGIPNRSALQQSVTERLRLPGATVALGMVDLDAFKDVNDSFGHHCGDEMLIVVAERLVAAIGDRGEVCRFGGDEFMVALYDTTPEDTTAFFRRLVDDLSTPVLLQSTAIEVGASIGVALAPQHASSWPELVRKADLAMYAAKGAGRVAVVYDDSLDDDGRSRLTVVAALHRAIDAGELDVFVQPKASLGDGVVASAEALVRWTDDALGSVPPEEFIALAERSGLIRDLTSYVLDQAVQACAGWQGVARNIGVAVNISARCLQDDSLEGAVDSVLRRHRLPASLLTLEITESSIMADPGLTFDLLDRLRSRGVRLSIDDFGTGYSSLSYLSRLPVSEVKIDRSFITRLANSPDDAAVIRAIIELGHTLDLEVIAEGIEDEDTWELLRLAGCDLAQGYLLARPMPVAEFPDWFVSHQLRVITAGAHPGVRQLVPPQR